MLTTLVNSQKGSDMRERVSTYFDTADSKSGNRFGAIGPRFDRRHYILRHYGAVTVFKIGVVATTTTVYKVSHVDIMMNFHDWHLQGGAAKSGKNV